MRNQWPELRNVVVLIVSDDRANDAMLINVLDDRGCIIRSPGPKLAIDAQHSCDVGIVAVHRLCGWTAGVITALRASSSACAAVTLLSDGSPEDVAQSLRYGAVDCLVKPVSPTELLESLSNAVACTYRWRERIAASRARTAELMPVVFEPAREPALVVGPEEQRLEDLVDRLAEDNRLTPREREVLHWLVRGHRYDDIATVLGVAPRTAKFHAANLLRKLDLDSRHDLPRLLARES